VASVAAAGQLTPQVAEAAISLLDACRAHPGVEPAVIATMQRVAMLIGETLARQHAPPSTRLVEALSALELNDSAQRSEAVRLLQASFAPGGACSREQFIEDVSFFLESLAESEGAFNASVQETVEKGSAAAFEDVKAAAEGRRDARARITALLALAREV
jgi:hypothetical protein